MTDFEKYASLDRRISSMTLNRYGQFVDSYINPDVANIIQAQLLYLASVDDKADISLYINTPGGAVSAGLGIYDTMQLVRPDIATICTGMAASMGSVLLCSGADGKRSCLPHSRILMHQPLGGVRGQAADMDRDYWMDADGAVSYGMVDQILGTNVMKEFKRNSVDGSVQNEKRYEKHRKETDRGGNLRKEYGQN